MADLLNIYQCISNSREHEQLFREFSSIYTIVSTVFLSMYECLHNFHLNMYYKSLDQYPLTPKSARFYHITSILFVNMTYTRNKIASALERLKDPKSSFLGFFSRLGRSASTVFLLWLDRWPTHRRNKV